MEINTISQSDTAATGSRKTFRDKAAFWLTDPLRSVIVASATCMSSLGIVLGGSWFIGLALG